jgi:hypothetical protein
MSGAGESIDRQLICYTAISDKLNNLLQIKRRNTKTDVKEPLRDFKIEVNANVKTSNRIRFL